MLTEHDQKLADVLLDSLLLNWQGSAEINADVMRRACIQALSEVLDVDPEEIVSIVDKRMQERQD